MVDWSLARASVATKITKTSAALRGRLVEGSMRMKVMLTLQEREGGGGRGGEREREMWLVMFTEGTHITPTQWVRGGQVKVTQPSLLEGTYS